MDVRYFICFVLIGIYFEINNAHNVTMKKDPDTTDHPDEVTSGIVEEADEEWRHKDFEPVIDFPGTDPNWKESPRDASTAESLEEEAHWSLHNIANALIHKELQTEAMMEEMIEYAQNGTLKPYVPMKPIKEKLAEEKAKKNKQAQG